MILEVSWDGLWTLCFGLSQFHGHGSWLVCEVALSVVGTCGLRGCIWPELQKADFLSWSQANSNGMPQASILRSLQLFGSRHCRVDGQPYPTLWTLYKHGELTFLPMWPGPIAGTSNSVNNVDHWIKPGFRSIQSQLRVTRLPSWSFEIGFHV